MRRLLFLGITFIGISTLLSCGATNSSSTYQVTIRGSQDIGGLVGSHTDDSNIRHSYSTSKVSGSEAVGGMIGGNIAGPKYNM